MTSSATFADISEQDRLGGWVSPSSQPAALSAGIEPHRPSQRLDRTSHAPTALQSDPSPALQPHQSRLSPAESPYPSRTPPHHSRLPMATSEPFWWKASISSRLQRKYILPPVGTCGRIQPGSASIEGRIFQNTAQQGFRRIEPTRSTSSDFGRISPWSCQPVCALAIFPENVRKSLFVSDLAGIFARKRVKNSQKQSFSSKKRRLIYGQRSFFPMVVCHFAPTYGRGSFSPGPRPDL